MEHGLVEYCTNNQAKKFIILTLFLFMLCSLGSTLFGDQSIYGLKQIQLELIQDQNDFYHVIGLAQNNNNMTLDRLFVDAIIFDNSNKTVGNYSNQVEVYPLNPDDITPFDILIYDKDINENINNYSVNFRFDIIKEIERNLDVHSVNSKLDFTGLYFINGKITNNMKTYSNNTIIIAAVFDKENSLIGIWKAQSEPYNIAPFATASFTIPVTDRLQSFKIHNFTLFSDNS